jgi:hypothetical protein
MVNKYYRLIVIFLLLVPVLSSYADLESFKDAVEAAEDSNEDAEDKPKSSSSKSHNRRDSSEDFFAALFAWLWLYNNYALNYGDYPYCDNNYIQRPSSLDETDALVWNPYSKKNYWFSTGLSAFYLQGMGGGSWFSWSGNIFKFFGPYIDGYLIGDEYSFSGTGPFLGGVRAGMHFSLFQSNVFNSSLYIQWQGWYGMLSRNGAVFGLETRLYPIKPVTLRAKAGFQVFEQVSIGELELEAGFMLKSWELFAGYRWWSLEKDNEFSSPTWQGAYLGLRRYF